MFLNACVHRLDLDFTSHPKDCQLADRAILKLYSWFVFFDIDR